MKTLLVRLLAVSCFLVAIAYTALLVSATISTWAPLSLAIGANGVIMSLMAIGAVRHDTMMGCVPSCVDRSGTVHQDRRGTATGFQDYSSLVDAQGESAPPFVPIENDDLFNIVYSSGTTGTPKGIIHTHHIRAMYCALFASTWRMTPESVVVHAGSLVFNGAFVTLMPALFLGTTYALQARFDAVEFIETVEREKVTHVMMVRRRSSR
jgi:acyl-coenzyme A synthetase/AMP-(fatty) acid ligase